MKRILFDIISLQGYHNGGEEYVRAILHSLMLRKSCLVTGVYDSNFPFLDNDKEEFSSQMKLLDIRKKSLARIVVEECIDTFFIGIAQRYSNYDLKGIHCRTICVIHDIGNIEYSVNGIYYHFGKTFKGILDFVTDYLIPKSRFSFQGRVRNDYRNIIPFVSQDNVRLITVSNYTKESLRYYFNELICKKIEVYYPPKKNGKCSNIVKNEQLGVFLEDSNPFMLLLNINRVNKNGYLALRVFDNLKSEYPGMRLVVTGASKEMYKGNILYLTRVSNSDIEVLYKKAWCLLYPSFTEGFGYPPLEAIKYGTPVISSNVCSMPEIFKDSIVYFSPFYENDLSNKINFLREHYDDFRDKALKLYPIIRSRQEHDFQSVMSLITGMCE